MRTAIKPRGLSAVVVILALVILALLMLALLISRA